MTLRLRSSGDLMWCLQKRRIHQGNLGCYGIFIETRTRRLRLLSFKCRTIGKIWDRNWREWLQGKKSGWLKPGPGRLRVRPRLYDWWHD
jgi:hypothetical protein